VTQILGVSAVVRRGFIGELLDSCGDPSPGLRTIVMAGAHKLVNSSSHGQKRYRRRDKGCRKMP